MSKFVVVAALLIAVATPGLAADFYVAQDPTTHKCKVFKEEPDGQTMLMVGTETYASKEEAKAAKKASTECKKKEDAN